MTLQEPQTEIDIENMMTRMGLVERIEKVIGPRKVLLRTGENEAETKTGVITLIMIKVNMIITINPTKDEIAIEEHHLSRKDLGKEVRIETIDIDIDQKAAHRIHAGIGQDLEVHIEKCLPKVVDGVIHIQVMRETLEKKEMCDVMKLDGVKKKKSGKTRYFQNQIPCIKTN